MLFFDCVDDFRAIQRAAAAAMRFVFIRFRAHTHTSPLYPDLTGHNVKKTTPRYVCDLGRILRFASAFSAFNRQPSK